jgi:hypothetical protein
LKQNDDGGDFGRTERQWKDGKYQEVWVEGYVDPPYLCDFCIQCKKCGESREEEKHERDPREFEYCKSCSVCSTCGIDLTEEEIKNIQGLFCEKCFTAQQERMQAYQTEFNPNQKLIPDMNLPEDFGTEEWYLKGPMKRQESILDKFWNNIRRNKCPHR